MNPVRSLHLQPSVTNSTPLCRSTIPAISCWFDGSPVRRVASCRNVSQLSYSTKISSIASRIRSGLNVTCIQSFFGFEIVTLGVTGFGMSQKDESPRLIESWDASPKQPSPKCCSIPSLRRILGMWNGTDGWHWGNRKPFAFTPKDRERKRKTYGIASARFAAVHSTIIPQKSSILG